MNTEIENELLTSNLNAAIRIKHLKAELEQQKFNNKHNLSIDQEVSDEIVRLKAEVEKWKSIAQMQTDKWLECKDRLEHEVAMIKGAAKDEIIKLQDELQATREQLGIAEEILSVQVTKSAIRYFKDKQKDESK